MANYGATSKGVAKVSASGAELELSHSTTSQSQQEQQFSEETGDTKTANDFRPVPDQPTGNVLQSKKLTDIEISSLTVLYAILLLTVGFVLFGDWYSGNTESEFIFGEGYTMVLMTVSLLWMLSVPLKSAWEHRKENKAILTIEQSKEGLDKGRGRGLLVKTLSLFAAFSELLTFLQVVDASLVVDHCVTPVAIASAVMKLIFIPAQVCLIVYSRQHVQRRKSIFSGLMVTQIIVTNMILYIWIFIKSKEGIIPLIGGRCPSTIGSMLIQNSSRAGTNATSNECEPTFCNKLFHGSTHFAWSFV